MMRILHVFAVCVLLVAVAVAQQAPPPAQVSIQEVAQGLPADGSRWLTFGGNYDNHRHSPLTQIGRASCRERVWIPV